jgi:hypothetical protein
MWHLTATIVAGCSLMTSRVCGRWLLVWLFGSRDRVPAAQRHRVSSPLDIADPRAGLLLRPRSWLISWSHCPVPLRPTRAAPFAEARSGLPSRRCPLLPGVRASPPGMPQVRWCAGQTRIPRGRLWVGAPGSRPEPRPPGPSRAGPRGRPDRPGQSGVLDHAGPTSRCCHCAGTGSSTTRRSGAPIRVQHFRERGELIAAKMGGEGPPV